MMEIGVMVSLKMESVLIQMARYMKQVERREALWIWNKTWPDGRKYEGEWKMGKPIGVGKKVYPDGKVKMGIGIKVNSLKDVSINYSYIFD